MVRSGDGMTAPKLSPLEQKVTENLTKTQSNSENTEEEASVFREEVRTDTCAREDASEPIGTRNPLQLLELASVRQSQAPPSSAAILGLKESL